MNLMKMAIGTACSIMVLLILLVAFIEKPEKTHYEKTVEVLMLYEGLSSFQETVDHFPELKDIAAKMERITLLSERIHRITGGPAPTVSREESHQVQDHTQEIRHLREVVEQSLAQLLAIYKAGTP